MKALVGAFNQEKAPVGAFSVIVQPVVEPMEHYTALVVAVTLNFNISMQDETADIAAVTCGLLDNMVTVCGEVWRQCHDLAQVIIISTLLHVTRHT